MKFTSVIEKSEDGWFVDLIEEVSAAISQGETVEELRENLLDALMLIFDTNRQETEKDYKGKDVIREALVLA